MAGVGFWGGGFVGLHGFLDVFDVGEGGFGGAVEGEGGVGGFGGDFDLGDEGGEGGDFVLVEGGESLEAFGDFFDLGGLFGVGHEGGDAGGEGAVVFGEGEFEGVGEADDPLVGFVEEGGDVAEAGGEEGAFGEVFGGGVVALGFAVDDVEGGFEAVEVVGPEHELVGDDGAGDGGVAVVVAPGVELVIAVILGDVLGEGFEAFEDGVFIDLAVHEQDAFVLDEGGGVEGDAVEVFEGVEAEEGAEHAEGLVEGVGGTGVFAELFEERGGAEEGGVEVEVGFGIRGDVGGFWSGGAGEGGEEEEGEECEGRAKDGIHGVSFAKGMVVAG